MASTIAGIPLVFSSLVSTPAKRSTRMMLGREGDFTLGTAQGIKSKPSPPSSKGISLVKSNARGSSTRNGVETILKMAADQKQWKLLDTREMEELPDHHMIADPFSLGGVVKDSRIFCENFTIRSYDMGPNRKASIETLMNLLQETALNHIKNMGMMKDGLGSTPSMTGKSLIWVLTKMHLVVDHYPSWGDEVQLDTWFTPSEKNGQGIYWTIRDSQTNKTLARANSMLVMMNKDTRKLRKMPEEVRREMESQYIDCSPIQDEDGSRILANFDYRNMDYVRTGLTPRWNDLDVNQHVNNVKYIGLMLESVPNSIMEKHEISDFNIEYRRECGMDHVLQSQTSLSNKATDGSLSAEEPLECFHLLRFENGAVVARARTKWGPKTPKQIIKA
ncbi:hypothetical protein NE237_029273 [Protea cynaroides]|uniref:Acyl-[acyl-carrier-protein] hydrolase n=1 Tax=Protea cynaroides TaxID=273540 RepID=A0A9Q0JUM3_9MAGN|nr:hypothetical protein NE237_029273 [Protea cynaroides]